MQNDEKTVSDTQSNSKGKVFGKTFIKAISLFLSLVLIYSLTYISYANPRRISVSSADVQSQGNSNGSGNNSNGSSNNSTVSTGSDTSGNNETGSDSQPADAGVAAIIEYYKTAHNNARKNAKSATLIYDGATNYNSVFEAGALSSVGQSLVDKFMVSGEKNEPVDPSALPPGDYISGLNANDVASATKEENGEYYIVKIVMKDDLNPVAGKGSGALTGVITQNDITEPVKGIVDVSNIALNYYGTSAEAKIEKSTGNMVYLKVDAPSVLSLDAKLGLVSIDGAKVGIECVSEYTIAY